jgi:very-short-patch-repair endonuclease
VITLAQSRSTPAIRVHRPRTFDAEQDRTHMEDGMPVTTVPRTLLDLATVLPRHRFERVVHRAELMGILDTQAVEELLARAGKARGASSLRAAMDALAVTGPEHTRSDLEALFLHIVWRFELPRPEVNARVLDFEVDFLWRAQRVVAEADGARYHLTAVAARRDRRRDVALQVAGYRVLRFTDEDIASRPEHVAGALRAVVGRPLKDMERGRRPLET